MRIIKKFIPNSLLRHVRPLYHGMLSVIAHWYFGRPSRKIIVIGVTGTNGKTTTVTLAAKILEEAGYQVGLTSTIQFKSGADTKPNTLKMTMPSGWVIHQHLRAMVDAGFEYAVLEVSSEGLVQNRHRGIYFDVAVFTNLTPEHLESHGGWENYKEAKGILFDYLSRFPLTAAKLAINPRLQKTIIVNADDGESSFYLGFPSTVKLSFGVRSSTPEIRATAADYTKHGIRFNIDSVVANRQAEISSLQSTPTLAIPLTTTPINLKLKGQFDVYNALAAVAIATSQNIPLSVAKSALEKIDVVPGRMEIIQDSPFMVVVDYAYEPEEMRQLYETVQRWPRNNIIQILGPTGGGRDRARIEVLGEMAGKFASTVIITTDDPYDDDPITLAEPMIVGAERAGREKGVGLRVVLNRREAMAQAFALATPGDVVLITGKGADQKMCLANGQVIDWDDRQVAREELQKTSY